MRVKTSITLLEDKVRAIDRIAGRESNRSRVIEEAIDLFLAQRLRDARDKRDLQLINRHADALNDEMADVLTFQAKL